MRVLVTGGAGYLGSVVVGQLLDRFHEVDVADFQFWAQSREFAGGLGTVGVRLFDYVEDTSLGQYDGIINLAAIAGEKPCRQWTRLAVRSNARLPGILAHQLGPDQFMVHASTTALWGDVAGQYIEDAVLWSPDAALYPHTKRQGELRLRGFRNVAIVRLPTLYGVSPVMRPGVLVNDMVREAVKTGEVSVYGNLNGYRPFASVGAAAEFIIGILENRRAGGHCAAAENLTKATLAYTIADTLDVPVVPGNGKEPLRQNHRVNNLGLRGDVRHHIWPIAEAYGAVRP